MTVAQQKHIELLVENKILEFFGDPDNRLSVKGRFISELRRRTTGRRKLTPHSTVAKRYAVR